MYLYSYRYCTDHTITLDGWIYSFSATNTAASVAINTDYIVQCMNVKILQFSDISEQTFERSMHALYFVAAVSTRCICSVLRKFGCWSAAVLTRAQT